MHENISGTEAELNFLYSIGKSLLNLKYDSVGKISKSTAVEETNICS